MPNVEINREVLSLAGNALVTLYILDASDAGGGTFRFYPASKDGGANIIFQGETYIPFPCEVKGMEFKGEGSPPRPTITFANIAGTFSALVLAYDDLIGARFIRRRTFAQFLDGEPEENALAVLPDDTFTIERKTAETRLAVEFELGTPADVDGVSLPKRIIHSNLCNWRYRGGECGFAGDTVVADSEDVAFTGPFVDRNEWNSGTAYVPGDVVFRMTAQGILRYFVCLSGCSGEESRPPNTLFWGADVCSKRIRGCELRFPSAPEGLPYGGFPAASRIQ